MDAMHMQIRYAGMEEPGYEIIRKDAVRCVYVVEPERTAIAYSIEYDGLTVTRVEHFRNETDCMWRYRQVLNELTGTATDSPYYRPIGREED